VGPDDGFGGFTGYGTEEDGGGGGLEWTGEVEGAVAREGVQVDVGE
jgi:hypothetical protein